MRVFGNEGVMEFLWGQQAFYFIQISTAAQHELTESQERLTSTTAIICEEWESAMCCTSFFSTVLIFFFLYTGIGQIPNITCLEELGSTICPGKCYEAK